MPVGQIHPIYRLIGRVLRLLGRWKVLLRKEGHFRLWIESFEIFEMPFVCIKMLEDKSLDLLWRNSQGRTREKTMPTEEVTIEAFF